MKKIHIIRHAKSSWKHNVSDHQRPLKKRGRIDAENVAKHTSGKHFVPDRIYCSIAKRTQETAKYFLDHWNISEQEFILDENLYDFSGENLLKTIQNCHDSINSLMIFGHNFAITDFVNTFGNVYIDNVTTCGFITIEFDIDSWLNLEKGKTVYKLFPKEIRV